MKKFHHDDIPPVEKENERDETYQGINSKIDSTRTKDNSEVKRAHQDQAFMYKRLQSAERTAASCEKSHSEVTEIKAVLPREYEELLRRARTTKAATHKSPAKFNGNSK